MNSAAEFAEAFRKYKEAQPEYAKGFSFEKLSQWHDEFWRKVVADIRREAYTEAAKIVKSHSEMRDIPVERYILMRAAIAITEARDKIK